MQYNYKKNNISAILPRVFFAFYIYQNSFPDRECMVTALFTCGHLCDVRYICVSIS